MFAFADLEPSIIQSGTLEHNGKMIKHDPDHLRYAIMNITMSILRYSPIFYEIYLKKRYEGNVVELLYLVFEKNLLELFTA